MMQSKLRSVRNYLHLNRDLWSIIPDKLQPYLRKYIDLKTDYVCFDSKSSRLRRIHPNAYSPLFRIAKIIAREKKRRWYETKGYDYIEGLNIHNSSPQIYLLLKQFKINSIHELARFIDTMRSPGASFVRLQYPQIIDLIIWWDTIGKYLVKDRSP